MRDFVVKVCRCALISLGAVCLGAALILASPIVFFYLLFSRPSVSQQKKDEWYKKFKDLVDPDANERWKREHNSMYADDQE